MLFVVADAVNKSVKYYMIATLRIIYHYKCTMQVAPNTSICDFIVNLVIKLKKKKSYTPNKIVEKIS
jgi:hypothetical protein